MNCIPFLGYRTKRGRHNRTFQLQNDILQRLVMASRMNMRQDTESDFSIMTTITVELVAAAGVVVVMEAAM